jgi:hypothetical protein
MPGLKEGAAFLVAACMVSLLALSCAGPPKTRAPQEATGRAEPQTAVQPSAGPAFDPNAVPEEVKVATIADVRAFIDSLNQIIRRQDYDAWLSNLTDEYIRHNSDPAILQQYSEYPIIKNKGIRLQTLKDYFLNVVYPSRQNDKVDDIEFVREDLIKAITVSPKGDRNILYMLEKHGDTWKIGIGRQ